MRLATSSKKVAEIYFREGVSPDEKLCAVQNEHAGDDVLSHAIFESGDEWLGVFAICNPGITTDLLRRVVAECASGDHREQAAAQLAARRRHSEALKPAG